MPRDSEKPIRRYPNKTEKRALKAAEVKKFLQQYGRPTHPGHDPNDRHYDPDFMQKLRRLLPEELDKLMRDDED